MKSPRIRLSALLALFAASGAAGLAGASDAVTLGVANAIGYGPIYCAIANGSYQKYGLDVHLVNISDNSVMAGALQSGQIDASTLTYDQVLAADAHGGKLKVVMPIDYSVGGHAILGIQEVRSIKDLKGRKVAFLPASPADFLLGYALAKQGLSEKDITAVDSTPEGVVRLMTGGSVEVGVTQEPNVSVLTKSNGGTRFHIILSSHEARGMITDVLVLKESEIAKNPHRVKALIRGTLDGLEFMQTEPAKANALIAKALAISTEEVADQLQNIENPSLERLGDVFKQSDALPSFYASGRIINELLQREGQIDSPSSIEGTYDASFVAALQAGGSGG